MTCRFFCHFGGVFCPSIPLTTRTIKIFEKQEKNFRRYYHFTYVYHKWQSHDIWFLRYQVRETFFSHLGPFFGLSLSNNQKIKIFKKSKKHLETWSYTSVPKLCRCGAWRMPFLLFSFYPFTLLMTWKIKTFKKWKKRLEIFYTCVLKIMIPWCTFPEIWCGTDGRMDLTDRRKTAGWKDRGKKGYIEIGVPPKTQNWAYLWINSLRFYIICFHCMSKSRKIKIYWN